MDLNKMMRNGNPEEKRKIVSKSEVSVNDVSASANVDRHDVTTPDNDGVYCGVGNCRPKALQCFGNIVCFTVIIGFASLVLQTLTIYVVSQVTSLEKHFGISSTTAGLIVSCNDIGFLSLILFVSHFGRNSHKPRVISIASAIFGFSGILTSIAYFADPVYLPQTIAGDTSNKTESVNYLCSSENVNSTDTCTSNMLRDSVSKKTWAVWFVAIMMVVQGMSKTPRSPFIASYVDNNVKDKTQTGLFLGIITTFTLFGPAIALALGGIFSKIPVDLSDTKLTPSDPRWIGAWWLGFIIFGSLSIVVVLPLFFFPRRLLPVNKQTVEKDKEEEETLLEKVKDLPKSFLRVLRQPVYVLMLSAGCIINFAIVGGISFGPKYLETQFGIPAWQSNITLGVEKMISTGLGTLIGGFLVTRFKMSSGSCLKFLPVIQLIAVAVECLVFVFGCNNQPIHGLDIVPSNYKLDDGITTCSCAETPFLPVCGGNDVTYYSPCHAGCKNQTENVYGECLQAGGDEVTLGVCQTGCSYLYPYMAVTLVYSLVGTLGVMPSFIVLIRNVEERDKTLAVGVFTFLLSVLGFIPAPILYGKVIDSTCKVWNYTCGVRGACGLYDIEVFRLKYHGLAVGLKSLGFCVFVATLIAHIWKEKRCKAVDLDNQTTEDTKM